MVSLVLALAPRPAYAQATDTAALAGSRAAAGAGPLVLPATLGSAAGTVLGFLAGESLGWGGGDDPGLTGALLGAAAGSVAGTSVGLVLGGRGTIAAGAAIPAATVGVAAGLGTLLLLGAAADPGGPGLLIGYCVGQGLFAGLAAGANRQPPAAAGGRR